MNTKIKFIIYVCFLFCTIVLAEKQEKSRGVKKMEENLPKTEEEWKKILSTDAYQVLRKKGTERAFTGKYHDNKEKGVYICAGCGQELFSSDTKFDSGTGWPSFFEPISSQNVGTETDKSFFMTRTEVHCSRCGGHLGHVFSDGPKPTGLRYCINSVSLGFKKKP